MWITGLWNGARSLKSRSCETHMRHSASQAWQHITIVRESHKGKCLPRSSAWRSGAKHWHFHFPKVSHRWYQCLAIVKKVFWGVGETNSKTSHRNTESSPEMRDADWISEWAQNERETEAKERPLGQECLLSWLKNNNRKCVCVCVCVGVERGWYSNPKPGNS